MTTARFSNPFTKRGKLPLVVSVVMAAVLWFIMFSPWTAPQVNFWAFMAASAIVLTCFALIFGGRKSLGLEGIGSGSAFVKTCVLGFVIAALLWGIFYVGDKVSQLLFSFARPQVDNIYDIKGTLSPTLLALLLLFVIGPAEEIFWRGYVQRTLSNFRSPLFAFIVTTMCYTFIHLPSGNFMLIMAALVCGIVWGGLYYFMPNRLTAIIISHALWDAAAFVWLPF